MLLSIKEVAHRLGCGERTVRRMIHNKEILARRLRGHWVVFVEDFRRYIDNLPTNGASA